MVFLQDSARKWKSGRICQMNEPSEKNWGRFLQFLPEDDASPCMNLSESARFLQDNNPFSTREGNIWFLGNHKVNVQKVWNIKIFWILIFRRNCKKTFGAYTTTYITHKTSTHPPSPPQVINTSNQTFARSIWLVRSHSSRTEVFEIASKTSWISPPCWYVFV